MFVRIREITDALGSRLRITVEERSDGAVAVLERPDGDAGARAVLDDYGVEVLAGYVMSARLAVPHPLPDEHVDGAYEARIALTNQPCAALVLEQDQGALLEIPAPFWDRLYAELGIVAAHTRELRRRSAARLH